MDKIDRRILDALQYDFPLCENPYQVLADKLGLTRDRLWERVNHLLDIGFIRRIGVSLDSHKLGYCSTLVAVRIDRSRVNEAAKLIGRFAEVTHSYLRRDEFNIWFTIIAPTPERITAILDEICDDLSLESNQIINVPVKRLFKLDARFNSAR